MSKHEKNTESTQKTFTVNVSFGVQSFDKCTYGKSALIAKKLLDRNDNCKEGDLITMDNKFMCVQLLEDYHEKKVGIIGTFNSKRSDKPCNFTKKYQQSKYKEWTRGDYEIYERGNIHFCAWKDSKVTYFVDNCFKNENYAYVQRWEKGNGERSTINAPVVAKIYNENKALVDAFNARKATKDIQPRSRRKYCPVMYAEIIRHIIINPFILLPLSSLPF